MIPLDVTSVIQIASHVVNIAIFAFGEVDKVDNIFIASGMDVYHYNRGA